MSQTAWLFCFFGLLQFANSQLLAPPTPKFHSRVPEVIDNESDSNTFTYSEADKIIVSCVVPMNHLYDLSATFKQDDGNTVFEDEAIQFSTSLHGNNRLYITLLYTPEAYNRIVTVTCIAKGRGNNEQSKISQLVIKQKVTPKRSAA